MTLQFRTQHTFTTQVPHSLHSSISLLRALRFAEMPSTAQNKQEQSAANDRSASSALVQKSIAWDAIKDPLFRVSGNKNINKNTNLHGGGHCLSAPRRTCSTYQVASYPSFLVGSEGMTAESFTLWNDVPRCWSACGGGGCRRRRSLGFLYRVSCE